MRAALSLLLVASVGCGASAVEVARGTVFTAATARTQADRLFADAYEIAANHARETATTQAEKDAQMAPWTAAADEMERVLRVVDASLAAAEVAIDGFEQTGEAGYYDEAIACAAAALRDIANVLRQRGLKTPAALAKVLMLTEGLVCAGTLQ